MADNDNQDLGRAIDVIINTILKWCGHHKVIILWILIYELWANLLALEHMSQFKKFENAIPFYSLIKEAN